MSRFFLKTLFILFLGFLLVNIKTTFASEGEFVWNTFLGGSGSSSAGLGATVDSSGNIYISGDSNDTWGTPIRAHSGLNDAVISKLDSSGNILWNTFLGGSGHDNGFSITNLNGYLYVVGFSDSAWGTPIRAYDGVTLNAFVAKLDSSGNLLWNTFLGGDSDQGFGIVVDSNGNIYVSGKSSSTWGTPIRAYNSADDGFVAKLDSSGNLLWNTFLGGEGNDYGHFISIDTSDYIYFSGYSSNTWGTPIRAYGAEFDAFVAKLDSSGNLLWNTFLGGGLADYGYGIVANSNGVYLSGLSSGSWGVPVNEHSNTSNDSFVAKLDSSGNLLWNTFLGGSGSDVGYNITHSSNDIYITGFSDQAWGTPLNDHGGVDNDSFVAKLDSSGNLLWNTFFGDFGRAITIDLNNDIIVTGSSGTSWGTPIRSHSGGSDIFIVKLNGAEIIISSESEKIINIRQQVTAEISLTIGNTSLIMTSIPGLTGGESTVATNVNVITNNSNGYTLTVSADNQGKMMGDVSGGEIPAYVPILYTPEPWSILANTSAFGFSFLASSDDTISGSMFNGKNNGSYFFPATTTVTALKSSLLTSSAGASSTIIFKTQIKPNPSPVVDNDNYTATTTITVYMN